ncbi:MAG: binding-protein-dependent transport system inner rane component, partial [Thermomicrobiales bacterium]|nr:binding-protein-dependent transport system inner rane component [Thermomicrobiales bacterium]
MAEIEIDIGQRRAVGVRTTHRGLRYRWQLWLLLLPYLAGLTLLVVIPALVGLPLAFSDFNALQPPAFNGLDNLVEMSGDPIFWKSVFNSGVYIALAVPLRLLGALAMALLLLRAMRGIGVFRAAVYLPTV